MVRDHGPGEYPPGISDEIIKESILLCGQVNLPGASQDDAASGVKREICKPEHRKFCLFLPSEQRPNPGDKLLECEWFGQIVVSACIQTQDLIFDICSYSEQQHRG